MVTRRKAREVVKKVAERYLPWVSIAHLVCSTLLLNYLVAHLVVTTLWFFPKGGKDQLIKEEKLTSATLEGEQNKHRGDNHHDDFVVDTICLTYILLSVLSCIIRLVTVSTQRRRKRRKEGADVEGRMNTSIKQENIPLATRWKRQVWVACTHLISYVILALLGLHRGRGGKSAFFPFILVVCEMGTPLISLLNIVGSVKKGYINSYLKEKKKKKKKKKKINKVELFLFLFYFAIEKRWRKNLRRNDGGQVLDAQREENKGRNTFSFSLKKEWFLRRCINLCVDWLERQLSSFQLCNIGRGEESTAVRVPSNRTHSPKSSREGGISPPGNVTSHVGTNTVERHRGEEARMKSNKENEEDNLSRGRNEGGSSHFEKKSADAQLKGTTGSEGNGGCSSNPEEKHYMKKRMEQDSASHTHEERLDSEGELCERVKKNAHKYKHFYHQYCREEGEDVLEDESSSRETPFLKFPMQRERRKFNVIQGGRDHQHGSDVASPKETTPHSGDIPLSLLHTERHNISEKERFNFGNAQMKNLNDRRSYTSLYFPSVIETDMERGSISQDRIIDRSGSGGGNENMWNASPCKAKEKSPSEANPHKHSDPRVDLHARDKLEGIEEEGTCLNERGEENFSVGHLLNDVNRREEYINASLLMDGKYLQKGKERKKMKEGKKHHCVYLSPDGMKYSHSNKGEDNVVSSNEMNSLEAHIRTSLSNFKRKKEILTFINDIYNTIFMISILSMLLTKGILICTFLYFLHRVPIASGRSFPSGLFSLLQICHFTLFHLYVREYRAGKRYDRT
ncbi:conserved Plasmodium protein, unknown function [Plasmodium knowlesi strain H]|uniref:Uncharacterized protein n=1 Tax=Plasmodium knowlesi (strain H) TaxID=5851 RepID=B3L0A5_PLAKH|nr:conserved Plasmodium protein, unknown function [Plasmodium knowlesi strain H]CAA9986594.1 conserved Plasmodium protein, unknown function [Plasmodium knowlesi strain H]VVS76068.1 conserved Plasmodium protein, unknown function [Plasmodium knowlesi strain H]|eukprot:XP_002261135.1 hypothetical protein, conserved in Plasmodium species [Plasmodium knowlesi strain H]